MKPFISPAMLMVFLLLFTHEAICQGNSLDKYTTSGPDQTNSLRQGANHCDPYRRNETSFEPIHENNELSLIK